MEGKKSWENRYKLSGATSSIIVGGGGAGRKERPKTIDAMKEVSLDIAAKKPEILVVITPTVHCLGTPWRWESSGSLVELRRLRPARVSLSFTGHTQMAFDIMEEAARRYIRYGR